MGHTTPDETKVPLVITTVPLRQMADPIRTLLARGGLHTVFQPILDGASREAIGYEALTRGPADHELSSPIALIALAAKCGMSIELERACIHSALRSYRQLQLKGRLF